ncbi:MAG TPA: FAD:protein FMN transferase [Aequorivita sp.]|nr:FAD:protein FMN transferase [Aequorivita sp.]
MRYIVVLLSVFIVSSCAKETSSLKYLSGDAFGTTYNVQFFSSKDIEVKKGIDSAVAAINQSVSTYIHDSDISKINKGDSALVVDDIFIEAFNISKGVYEKTNGYFDPTVGVLRNAYGFGDTDYLNNIDTVVLDSLMQFVGFQKVKLNEDGTIFKESPHIYFDFNAVAKGSGLDYIGKYLESRGITNYLIELGGEILAKGKNLEKNQEWIIGIETPDSELEDRTYGDAVKLTNMGLASSGNYRKFRVDSITGKKYVHTINPLTGSAEMSDVTSATVIAPTCGEADAYATAFMALGFEKSKDLLQKLSGIEAYLTYTDSTNTSRLFITNGFKRRLVD